MAEQNPGDGIEIPQKKSSSSLYLIIFVVQLLLVGAFFFFFAYPWYMEKVQPIDAYKEEMQKGEEEEEEGETQEGEALDGIGPTFILKDLTVNPKNSRGRRFAIFEITLEVDEEATIESLKLYEPIIKDRYIDYFRAKTVNQLTTDSVLHKGKVDLMGMTNGFLGGKKIKNIYFTRFVLQ